MYKIRPITSSDAHNFNQLYKQIEAESPFMLYEKDERKTSAEAQAAFITKLLASKSSMIFLAEEDSSPTPVGFIATLSESMNKKAHVRTIVMGLLKNYQGKRIGTALMAQAIDHAKSSGAGRIELTVIDGNEAAINLYKKFAFEIEGIKRQAIKQQGQFVDEVVMGKLL